MAPFLLVSDLDHTLVGDREALAELNQHLKVHRQNYGTKLVYSTGRSWALYHQLTTEQALLKPDALILSVGTEIYLDGSDSPNSAWTEKLSHRWDRDQVVASAAHFADLVPQPATEQRPFKVSYLLTNDASVEVIPKLDALLRDRGLDIQLIYSGGIDLDILPKQANKGSAMTFLRQQLEMPAERTVACGDSGNDLSMLANREERGIIVGNAMPELLQWYEQNPNSNCYLARSSCAGGILEGLRYFGFLDP